MTDVGYIARELEEKIFQIKDNKVFEVQTELVSTSHYKPLQTILTNKVMTNQISVQLNKNGLQINLVGTIQQVLQHIDEVGANASHVNIPGYYYSQSKGEFKNLYEQPTMYLLNIVGTSLEKGSKAEEVLDVLIEREKQNIQERKELKERSL